MRLQLESALTRKVVFLVLSLFVLVSFVYKGYQFMQADQRVYLAQIHALAHPELLHKDLLSEYNPTRLTLFGDMMVRVEQVMGEPMLFVIMLVLSAFVRFIFMFAVYRLALYFTEDKIFSVCAPLVFYIPYLVSVANPLTQTAFLPRTVALAFALLSFAFYVEKKEYLATLFLTLTLLFHVLAALPFLAMWYVDLFFRFLQKDETWSRRVRLFLLGLIPAAAFAAYMYFHVGNHSSVIGLFTRLDPPWTNLRPASYALKLLSVKVMAILLLFIVCRREWSDYVLNKFDPEKRRLFFLFLLIPIAIQLFAVVMANGFRLAFFASLQMTRATDVLSIILPLVFSFFVIRKISEHPEKFVHNFLTVVIALCLVAFRLVGVLFLPGWLLLEFGATRWREKVGSYKSLEVVCVLLSVCLVSLFLLFGAKNFANSARGLLVPSVLATGIALFVMAAGRIRLSHVHVRMNVWWLRKVAIGSAVIVALLAVMIITSRFPSYTTSPLLSDQSFMEACSWLKNNTTPSDVVEAEPFSTISTELRLFCDKSVFYSETEDPAAILNRDYALEVHRRKRLIASMAPDGTNVAEVLRAECVRYVISGQKLALTQEPVFANSAYVIYRLDPVCPPN